jgi:anthranilate/para-aminobenzoate synthase component I
MKLEEKDYLRLFINSKERLGAYAHFTSISCMDKAYLSNSPECLFKAFNSGDDITIRSMPIKGTVEDRGVGSWSELKNSKKDQGELYMITDLVRNDLSKIKLTPSRVIKRKAPLRVPGIVHQFSVVDTTVEKETSLLNVIEALFPGGSITGAPKKRVMEIIKQIEKYPRGFYCGSTVLLHKSLKCASINIRSAEISLDKQEIKYGSGGGVTLLSKCEEEFKESFQKMESFIKFLDVEIVSND